MESPQFQIREGLRQSGELSPKLFTIIMMDSMTEKIRKLTRAVHGGYCRLKQIVIGECTLADDILIFANNEKELQNNINIWSLRSKRI